VDYNSFLSKDYKFENTFSRKKNYNYKVVVLGIVMLSVLLLVYGTNFSNQASIAQANSEHIGVTEKSPLLIEQLELPVVDSSIQIAKIDNTKIKPKKVSNSSLKTQVKPSTSKKLPQLKRSIVTVRKKDSMSAIFKRNRFSPKTLHHLVYKTKLGKQLTRLKPGQKVTFLYDNRRSIHVLRLQKNKKEALILERNINNSKLQFSSSILKLTAEQKLNREIVKDNNTATSSLAVQEDTSDSPQEPLTPLQNIVKTSTDKVKKGDNLASIFKRNNLNKSTLHYLVHSSKLGKQLTRIRPGQELTFGYDKDHNLVSMQLHKNRIETLILQRDYKSQSKKPVFVSYLDKKEVEIRSRFNTGTIDGSFFYAAKTAGMSDAMTMKLAHLFGWDIDFALNIRAGDSFSVLYEEKYLEGEKIGNGDIIAAEFINQGKVFQAVRYTDVEGRSDYYTPEGYSMRKAFLRTPVAFSRISSRFSLGRKHPILNRIRAHKGVDYAAPRGTPIKATGSGKVIHKGRKGGYGKVVEIRHANKYRTLYAHLSSYNRKIKHGSRVKQGQVIGYVGSTGLATGPHLHYEFRVNGSHRNPLTVKLPNAAPINKKYKSDFMKVSHTLLSKLTLEKKQQIASAK